MKGAILKSRNMYYTCMDKIFSALDNMQLNYNWLITDYECDSYPDERIPFNKEYIWISGEELSEIVYNNPIQFIWGVFSAFNKNIALSDVLLYELPDANENQSFWKTDFKTQHPLAEMEIVPFDSSLVLLISKHTEIVDLFMKAYPLAEDLAIYNAK